MNPSVLEKLTIIFFIASGLFFLSSVFYAIKFKVITSFLFEIKQKKLKKKNGEPDIAAASLAVPPDLSVPDKNRTTGTISVRKKATGDILLDIVPSEKTDDEEHQNEQIVSRTVQENSGRKTVPASQMRKKDETPAKTGTIPASQMRKKDETPVKTGTIPASQMKKKKDEDASVKINKTVAVRNRKPSGVFSITESIVVTTCTEDDIRCIDEAQEI